MNTLQLEKVFKTHTDRSLFISEYKHFGEDGNEDFYTSFINKSINEARSKRQEDAIELSIALHYYRDSYVSAITQIIKSRRCEWMKLLCLDWLFNFYKEVPKKVFIDLNDWIISKANTDILKLQAVINLILADQNFDIGKRYLSDLLCSTSDHALFYRVINVLNNDSMSRLKSQMKAMTLSSLETNGNLTERQIEAIKAHL